MRKKIIAGNWKMYKGPAAALELVSELKEELAGINDREIVVIPPFVSIFNCHEALKGSNIQLGAQDMFWEEEGAFTGEISPIMLKECGCRYCIIGHSERRMYFGETDETINKKVKASLAHSITPICCVGETKEQRDSGMTFRVLEGQLRADFNDLTKEEISKMVIAYEPIWAIGTGLTATPDQANEVHAFIRRLIASLYDEDLAMAVRIQYGGSVKPDNCDALMAQPDIDGALIGGASLKGDSFARIVRYEKL